MWKLPPVPSVFEVFQTTAEAINHLLLSVNVEERKKKAFYGNSILQAAITSQLWKHTALTSDYEDLIDRSILYESNFSLACFLLFGTDFLLVCRPPNSVAIEDYASLVKSLIWDFNIKEDKSPANITDWLPLLERLTSWINRNFDFKTYKPKLVNHQISWLPRSLTSPLSSKIINDAEMAKEDLMTICRANLITDSLLIGVSDHDWEEEKKATDNPDFSRWKYSPCKHCCAYLIRCASSESSQWYFLGLPECDEDGSASWSKETLKRLQNDESEEERLRSTATIEEVALAIHLLSTAAKQRKGTNSNKSSPWSNWLDIPASPVSPFVRSPPPPKPTPAPTALTPAVNKLTVSSISSSSPSFPSLSPVTPVDQQQHEKLLLHEEPPPPKGMIPSTIASPVIKTSPNDNIPPSAMKLATTSGHFWDDYGPHNQDLHGSFSLRSWDGHRCCQCGAFLILRKRSNKYSDFHLLGLERCPGNDKVNWVSRYGDVLLKELRSGALGLIGEGDLAAWGFLPKSYLPQPTLLEPHLLDKPLGTTVHLFEPEANQNVKIDGRSYSLSSWRGSQCSYCGAFQIYRKYSNRKGKCYLLGFEECPGSSYKDWLPVYREELLKQRQTRDASSKGSEAFGFPSDEDLINWGLSRPIK